MGIAVDQLNYCAWEKGLQAHGSVITSNHAHCIPSSSSGTLSHAIIGFRRHTAKQILEGIREEQEGMDAVPVPACGTVARGGQRIPGLGA